MYVNAQKCFNEDLGCVKEIQCEMFETLYGITFYTIECGRALQDIVFQFIESNVEVVILLTNSVYMLEKLFFISFGLTECITLFRL